MKPTIPEVLKAHQGRIELSRFCCFHIVVEDENIEDHHIDFCIGEAEKKCCENCQGLGDVFKSLSKTQRKKLVKGF